jgi:alkylation response protein AidB-like acyl-CoA dehydrogenase
VNFDYSDDQKFLKSEARKFLEARCQPVVTRAVLDDPDKPYDADLWRAVVEMGWTGVAIPEAYGGSGLGHVELCAIAEEFGRVIAPIPFASTVYVFAEAIMLAGSEAQKRVLLPGVVSGAVIGCLATAEGPGVLTAVAAKVKVVDGYITGAKIPVTDGDIATHAIVSAQDASGLGLFVVNLSAQGVVREAVNTVDPTRSAARLVFDKTPCERLDAPAGAEGLLSEVLDRAAVMFAFEQVGGADRCLEMAKGYAMERYAFGRVIASYQAIKHKLADMYVKTELARSHAYYGAWALATGDVTLPKAAAAARLSATTAYDFAAKENLQTHGVGFTWEVDCHLHLRRSRQLGLALGGAPVWRERLIRRIEQSNAA